MDFPEQFKAMPPKAQEDLLRVLKYAIQKRTLDVVGMEYGRERHCQMFLESAEGILRKNGIVFEEKT